MSSPDLISASEAAERRGVSRQAVYKALDSGALNDYRTGHMRLVVVDGAFEEWMNKPIQPGKPTDTDDSPNR